MPPPIQIRPATPEDYPAVVAAGNAAYADTLGNAVAPFDAARMHEDDADRPAHCKSALWVAEVDGQVVGAVEFDQAPHRYHPRRFWFDLYVHPTAQRQGIGTALYNQAEAALLVLNASIA
ncbi:MAG TPA: GNAT family N-acetyltransferase, partial [Chloroflexia bacterium]|nr:GNAT family N-acetyltransferase [Chloroflexia bacterium]